MMFSEIFEWLGHSHNITGNISVDCLISQARVCEGTLPELDAVRSILFILDADSAVPDSDYPLNLLIICDSVTCDACNSAIPILHCGKDVYTVCSMINMEIDRQAYIDHAMSRLMDLMNRDDFLEPLMDYLYLLYDNPIAYFDYTHTVLSYREKGPTGIYIWDRSMESRSLDPDIVDEWFLKSVQFMVDTKQTDHTVFEGNVDYYACPVMYHETLYGFICIMALRGPLKEHELALLQKVSNLVALVYNRLSNNAGNGDYREIIKDILDGKIPDERDLKVRMVSRNWHLNKRYQLIAIELKDASEEYMQYVLDGIDSISAKIKKLVYEHCVLVLLENAYRQNEVLQYVERYELSAGVSEVFEKIIDIKVQLPKALQAIYIGRMLGHRKSVYHYSQYRFWDMICAIQAAIRCDMYYHPIVGELKTYDKKNNTEFMRTLLAYLEHGNSVHKASEALHLHKNTVNYRIQRIRELFKLDYGSADEINHIFLSLKLNELDDIIQAHIC